MKVLGSFLMWIAGIFLFWAMFFFDTSVSISDYGYGPRVHNLGLMNDKRNYVTISGLMFIFGLILYIFNHDNKKQQAKDSRSVSQ